MIDPIDQEAEAFFKACVAEPSQKLWWYLEFRKLETLRVLGWCLVREHNIPLALLRSRDLGINPFEDVSFGGPWIESELPPEYPREVLIRSSGGEIAD